MDWKDVREHDDRVFKRLEICGRRFAVGRDDYIQSYFLVDLDDGKTIPLSPYNRRYIEEAYSLYDGRYHELERLDLFGELTDNQKAEMKRYRETIEEEYRKTYERPRDERA